MSLRVHRRSGSLRLSVVVLAVLSAQAGAADLPLTTDILPSGVPLPVPAPRFELPPDDDGTRLFGSGWGARDWLARHGLRLTAFDVEEVWGLARGGLRRGASYDGITAAALTAQTGPLLGWPDGLFNISALQIRGRSFADDRLGALNAVSGYDAARSTRLFELWYEQGLFGNRLAIRAGTLDLDTEFLVSQNASFFLNASFGWPLSPSSDLYSGGPSWPYSAPAVRVKWNPLSPLVLMAAVSDDNPTGGPFSGGHGGDASGTRFSLDTGALFIAEAQYWLDLARHLSGSNAPALPGTWKLGALYDSATFPDQRYDAAGGLLAAPSSSGLPLQHRGNWLAYLVVDQMIWRERVGSDKTINLFVRAMAGAGGRNLFDREVQAGLTFDELLPGRPDDTFGIAWGVATYSRRARLHGDDLGRFAIPPGGSRLRPEHHLELTYQAAATRWLNVQPDLQYFWNVGGGTQTTPSGDRIRNAVVLGLNVTTTF